MGKKGKKKSKGKSRVKVQNVVTPSQAQSLMPKLKQTLYVKDKEVKALQKRLSQTEAAAKALAQKAETNEAERQREKAELVQKLEQTEEESAAKDRELEAERAKFAEFGIPNRQGEDLLSHLRETARVNKEGWDRERARFSNFKVRAERQQEYAQQQGRLDTIKALLSTIDDLERATESLPHDIRDTSWGEGVELVHRNLLLTLQKYNVEEINPATGDIFDVNFHESAVAEECNEHESDRVIETIQKGYRVGDRLLRAAKVKVSR
ncbi:MAG: nucleotide exchange factor GrpE [Chloroflexi bacterium]|nr:nucleotide exchange factor GrpE [Chloroflexota bacterium]